MSQFRILSLDGGGVRGYLSALILRNIEAYLEKKHGLARPIGNYFDLIAGTSTGSIIGLGLALGRPAAEIVDFYEAHIPHIFPAARWYDYLKRIVRPQYKSDELVAALDHFFKAATLNDVKTDVCVPCTSLQNAKPRLYKSDYLHRNAGRLDEKLVDIALASSAAPTYFRAHSLVHSTNLVDGGLCANNPSMVALVEALHFERPSKRGIGPVSKMDEVVLLSVGTGEQCGMPYKVKSLRNGGAWQWLKVPSTPLLEVVFQSQSQIVHFQSQFLLKERYLRINPLLKFPMKLDDTKKMTELRNVADVSRDIEIFLNTYLEA